MEALPNRAMTITTDTVCHLAVMVLIWDEETKQSRWCDYAYKNRTLIGLHKALNARVKMGEFSAFRLITIHHEQFGVE